MSKIAIEIMTLLWYIFHCGNEGSGVPERQNSFERLLRQQAGWNRGRDTPVPVI